MTMIQYEYDTLNEVSVLPSLDVVCVLESERIERNGVYFVAEKMTINKRVIGTHLHCTWMLTFLSSLSCKQKK